MPPLWLTQLGENVINHIHLIRHQDWHSTEMVRGLYFAPPNAVPMPHHEFPAYHFFINNFSPRIRVFHCAAKLEHDHPANIRPEILQLFQGDNVQEGAFGGGLEIAWADVLHPINFNVADAGQNLPEELWIDIQARFLLRPALINFINECAP